jgi:hypothetical protein
MLMVVLLSKGLYPSPSARVVSPAELSSAKDDWKDFLHTLSRHIHSLSGSASSLVKALQELSLTLGGDVGLSSELHQLFRHGYESLAATMMWSTYVLARHRKVRIASRRSRLNRNVWWAACCCA